MPREKKTRNVRTSEKERWISITGPITAATATNFEKQLAKLAEESSEPIVVFLESPGGDSYACLKIYQTLVNLPGKPAPIYTVGVKTVQSGTFFILQAGALRFTTQQTRFRFHSAIRTYDNRAMNAVALAEEIRQLSVIDSAQLLLYTRHGRPIRKIQELLTRSACIDVKTALKLNLIDAVISRGSFGEMRAHIVRQ